MDHEVKTGQEQWVTGKASSWKYGYIIVVSTGRSHTDSSEVRVNGGPDADGALPKALADGELQQQERRALQHQEDEEGNHESPWNTTGYVWELLCSEPTLSNKKNEFIVCMLKCSPLINNKILHIDLFPLV